MQFFSGLVVGVVIASVGGLIVVAVYLGSRAERRKAAKESAVREFGQQYGAPTFGPQDYKPDYSLAHLSHLVTLDQDEMAERYRNFGFSENS